jgi:hypothetical protein
MSLPKPSAKIWIDYEKCKLCVSAPYNAWFNELIHNYPRHFDAEKKIWEFEIEYGEDVITAVAQVYKEVTKPPFLLFEVFDLLTKDDLKKIFEVIHNNHRGDRDKTLITLAKEFFKDYVDLDDIVSRKKRLIRIANLPRRTQARRNYITNSTERREEAEIYSGGDNLVDLNNLAADLRPTDELRSRSVTRRMHHRVVVPGNEAVERGYFGAESLPEPSEDENEDEESENERR